MVINIRKIGLALIFLFSGLVHAKDLGVWGPLFEIKEKDLVAIVEQKLKGMEASGALAYHQNQLLEKTKRVLQAPLPVTHLTETVNPRTFTWDPSITLTQDIKNHRNQVIYAKGTRLNPLETVAFKGQWLFFNGENGQHQAWAKSLYQIGDKLILVRGSPLQLMEDWNLPIFFDQQGVLSRKLGIRHVPARVSQEGQLFKVEEIRLEKEAS
jgi:conjugal transfer pilus assembly protein TraW